jgi:hypothetical protein
MDRARDERLRTFKRLLGATEQGEKDLRHEIETLCPRFSTDSEALEVEAAPGTGSRLTMANPANHVLLRSHSGSELRERAEAEPLRHLERLLVPWSEIEAKRSQCEAQQNRLFGMVNAVSNILPIDQTLRGAVRQLYRAERTEEWLRLTNRGVNLDASAPVINVYFSTAGGQGSGAALILLALLALHCEGRQRPRVYIHLLLPGFHPSAGGDEELQNELRTLAVLRDLAALKAGAEMTIPFPHGDKRLKARQAKEIFDTLFVYDPILGGRELYENFLRRVSDLVVSMELSPFARMAAKGRANVPDFGPGRQFKRLAALEGAQDDEKPIRRFADALAESAQDQS